MQCAVCQADADDLCTRCEITAYCSRDCQAKHWAEHRSGCAIGDDLPDMPVMARAGLAVAVPAAPEAVRRLAHYVTRAGGGAGAVRETIELLLTYQDRWKDVTQRYEDGLPGYLPDARRPWRARP